MHRAQHGAGVLRAQVAHGAGHQADVMAAGLIGDLVHTAVVEAVDGFAGSEVKVDVVGVANVIHRTLVADVVAHMPAHLIAEGQLAIRECARPRPAMHDGAGVAVLALPVDARRARAVGDRPARVHNQHAALRALLRHFQRGEDARRARADDDEIKILIFHALSPPSFQALGKAHLALHLAQRAQRHAIGDIGVFLEHALQISLVGHQALVLAL